MALSLQVIERDRGKYKGSVRQDEDRYILLEYFESHTVIKICVLPACVGVLEPSRQLDFLPTCSNNAPVPLHAPVNVLPRGPRAPCLLSPTLT